MIFLVGEGPGSVLRAAGRPFAAQLELPAPGADCPRGGRLDAVACADCSQLVVDAAGHRSCLMSGADAVGQWMSPLCRLATAAPWQRCLVARAAAEHAAMHHVLVLDGDRILVGIACGCDLARAPEGTVAEAMSGDVFATGPATTLAEAAAAMRLIGVGCLPVLREGLLLGLITRDQLGKSGAQA
jgi:CBS domain-containing protein